VVVVEKESQIPSQASRLTHTCGSVRPWSHGPRCRSHWLYSSVRSARILCAPRSHRRSSERCPPTRQASRSSSPRAQPATASTARDRRQPSSVLICRCRTVTVFLTSPTARPTPSSLSAIGWPSRIAAVRSGRSIGGCLHSATRCRMNRSSGRSDISGPSATMEPGRAAI
jgi:hypothetical protein